MMSLIKISLTVNLQMAYCYVVCKNIKSDLLVAFNILNDYSKPKAFLTGL